MTDELPEYDPLELRLAERAGRLAAPGVIAGATDLALEALRFYPQAGQELIAEGADPAAIAAFIDKARAREQPLPSGQSLPLSGELFATVEATFRLELENGPEGPARLDEKWVKSVTDFHMDIFHDESKHRGFPHVKVKLQDGDINISISKQPEVVAGTRGLRGEAAALKAVKKHHKALKKVWDDTRPDDQKLKPGK